MVAIFVVLMFVCLVLIDLGLVKWHAWRASKKTQNAIVPAATTAMGEWCPLPEGVLLAGGHTWLKPDPTGGIEVGADAFLAHAFGVVDRIVLPKPGDEVRAGQPLFRLEAQGRSVAVPASFDGRVVAVNSRLPEHREWVRSDPYSKGWVCYLNGKPSDAKRLPSGERAIRWLEGEFSRLREFLSLQLSPVSTVGLTAQDGGMPAAGCLRGLDAAGWEAFQAEFLQHGN